MPEELLQPPSHPFLVRLAYPPVGRTATSAPFAERRLTRDRYAGGSAMATARRRRRAAPRQAEVPRASRGHSMACRGRLAQRPRSHPGSRTDNSRDEWRRDCAPARGTTRRRDRARTAERHDAARCAPRGHDNTRRRAQRPRSKLPGTRQSLPTSSPYSSPLPLLDVNHSRDLEPADICRSEPSGTFRKRLPHALVMKITPGGETSALHACTS